MRPCQFNLALGHGQSSILGGIGRQLVQGYGNDLSEVRVQQDRRAVDAHARVVFIGIGSELLGRYCRQIGTNPARLANNEWTLASD